MRRLSPEEIQRQKRLEKLEKELKKIFQQTFSLALSFPDVIKAFKEANELFSIYKNRILIKKVNQLLKKQYSKLNVSLINSIQQEFNVSNSDLWSQLKNKFSQTSKKTEAFEAIKSIATSQQRDIVSQSRKLINESKNGLTISDRVWKSFENVPKEIEAIVQNGIKEGKSADQISRQLPEYLNDESKIFRRVKNPKTGKLELSSAARNYHPGQGVYRSSYKNALRLVRTEINRSYRLAEWNSYQNNPLITGYEIALSNNTENQCEVCKRLAGVYPKWFKWTGWHPQCRCRMIRIMITMKEQQELALLTLQGRRDEFKPKMITELPEQFNQYLDEAKERIANAANVPYWYEDNKLNLLPNSDYQSLIEIKRYFDSIGKDAKLLPTANYQSEEYQKYFGELKGTVYYKKCPDLKIDGKFYEHEGFKTSEPKSALKNMLNRGLKQSDRVIIEDCGLTDNYINKIINNRLRDGQKITEVWVKGKDTLRIIYKKTEE